MPHVTLHYLCSKTVYSGSLEVKTTRTKTSGDLVLNELDLNSLAFALCNEHTLMASGERIGRAKV